MPRLLYFNGITTNAAGPGAERWLGLGDCVSVKERNRYNKKEADRECYVCVCFGPLGGVIVSLDEKCVCMRGCET